MPLNISFILKGEMAMRSQKFTLLLLSLLLFLTSFFLTNFITPNLALADSPKAKSKKLLGTFLRGAFTDVIIKLLTLMHQSLLTLTMLSRIFVGMENMETLLLILIIQINKRGTVKESGVPLQNKEVPNGTLVLGEPWADVTKSYPGSGTTWEDCDKYARCGNFGELKRLKAKYPHLKNNYFRWWLDLV